MKRIVLCGLIAAARVAGALVIDGGYSVVVPDEDRTGVSGSIGVAGREIAKDLKERAGIDLSVVTAAKFKGGPAIHLGAEAARKAGLSTEGLDWYDNVIAEKDGSIYIFGNDRPGRTGKSCMWYQCVLPTVRGVARFLSEYAGVSWTLPGETGKTVPAGAAPKVEPGTFSKEVPTQVYGSGRGEYNVMMYNYANGIWGSGSFHSYGGHTYPDACPTRKYRESHPEYFALVKGKRKCDLPAPGRSDNPSLCISNPEVEQLIIDELLRRYDEGADVCQLGQEDGFKACECEKCRNFLHPDVSERMWLYHVGIAKKIEKLRPGKIVHIMSYGPTEAPPKTFKKFPSNVMIEICRYTEGDLARWKGYEVPHGYTVYVYFWGCYPLAGFTAKHTFGYYAEHARRFLAHDIRGVYRCGYGELHGMEGPGYYVFNRVLMDPKADPDKLLTEYCERTFGPAAKPMRAFYAALDDRIKVYESIYGAYLRKTKVIEGDFSYESMPDVLGLIGTVYDAPARARLGGLLETAIATPGLGPKEKRRLQLVRLEFTYAKNLGTIAELHKKYLAAPGQATALPFADALSFRNTFLDRLYDGKDRPRRLPDWPEMQLFRDYARSYLLANGRNGAAIKAPLDWDAAGFRDMYDVSKWKTADKRNRKLKYVTAWQPYDAQGKGKVTVSSGGRAFHLDPGPEHACVRAEHVFTGEWKPNTKYRVSWYAKVRDVKMTQHGGCAKCVVQFGSDFRKDASQLYLPEMRTSDTDWVHQAIEVTTSSDPAAKMLVFFRMWGVKGEVWIEDVSVEEL